MSNISGISGLSGAATLPGARKSALVKARQKSGVQINAPEIKAKEKPTVQRPKLMELSPSERQDKLGNQIQYAAKAGILLDIIL